MAVDKRTRISYYEAQLSKFSSTSGSLFCFEPQENVSVNFDDPNTLRQIKIALRHYIGPDNEALEEVDGIKAFALKGEPKFEVRCFSNGFVEIFQAPLLSQNQLAPELMQVRFDNIVLAGRRLDSVVTLISRDLQLKADVLLHITLLGVKDSFPFSTAMRKLRTDPFMNNVVRLPTLRVQMGITQRLTPLLRDHLIEGNIILNEDW